MSEREPTVTELLERVRALEKTNAALMRRVERTIDSAGNSFSLFESNILLHNKVRARTRELEERQHELLRLKDEAEAASRAKSEFLATMSHELRTPLNGVLGMAQMLLDPTLAASQRAECAQMILVSGRSLLALLNDVLDLSKVEAGKLDLELVPFAPAIVLGDVRGLFDGIAREKALAFEAEWVGDRRERYVGDALRLRQMTSNLVANALKFTSDGRVRVEAREIARENGIATLEVSVTDTGLGIPKAQQAHLFSPFVQADSSATRRFAGTGLGLSIVRVLAERMGGGVGLESEEGCGARVWFRVRAAVAPSASMPVVDRAEAVRIPPPLALAGHVLVAEDNPVNQRLVEHLLKRAGLTLDLVATGVEAVDAVRTGRDYDLVLMDVQMPKMDGLTATRAIRDWEQETGRARVPIVALTASVFDEDRGKTMGAGMDDFAAKPLSFAALDAILARWLPRSAKSA